MGIDVEVSTLALGALLESNNQNLRADQSAYDIAHILGFSVAGTVGAGLLAPLNDYVGDPARTPEGYDLADFPAGQLEYCGYFDVEAGQFGGDDLFLIPGIHSGSVIMYYRPDLYEEAGLTVPTNWEDYLANAEALQPGRRVGHVDDRRQRRLAVPRRLVLPVHHDGRRADERDAGDPGLRAQPDERGIRARPPAHDRLRRVLAERCHVLRVHRVGRRLLRRQRRADDLLVDDRRLGLRPRTVERLGHRRRGRAAGRRGPDTAGGARRLGPRHPQEPAPGAQGRRLAPAHLPHVAGVRAVPGA